VLVDAAGVQVISAADEQWIHPFTGLQPRQFRELVRLVAKRGGDQIADVSHPRFGGASQT
jgi:hypothetical protein